ncbi:MAG: aldehyde dehydrogenase family protein, partial [Mycobacterium sp.]
AAGIRKYCRAQAITTPRIPTGAKELLWYPSTPRRVKLALAVMRAGAARGLRRFGVSPRTTRT